jgi:thymidylate kinase
MSKVRPEIEQRINEEYNKFREQYDEISNKYQKDIDLINKDMLNKINNKKN